MVVDLSIEITVSTQTIIFYFYEAIIIIGDEMYQMCVIDIARNICNKCSHSLAGDWIGNQDGN